MIALRHTPGPWKALPPEADKLYIRVRGTRLGERFKIANALFAADQNDERDEAIANARLIASAPNLYAKVEIAAIIFEEYARLHLAKGTSDGNAKAKRNMEYALEMRAALASADTHPKGGDVKQAPSLMGSAVPKADAQ